MATLSIRIALCLITTVTLTAAATDHEAIRQQEKALAVAVKAQNNSSLAALLHVERVNSFASHRVEIARIDSVGRSAVQVFLHEFVTLRLPRGERAEQRIETQDIWLNQDGWKLASRRCATTAPWPIPARLLKIEAK